MIHGYPPLQNAGAEWMLHEMFKFMVRSGHKVEVLLPMSEMKDYEFEGVEVRFDRWNDTRKKIPNCDLLISHLDRAGRALNVAEYFRKPFVYVNHNSNYVDFIRAKHEKTKQVYVIYNSLFTKGAMKYPNPSMVVHPPVDGNRYKVKRGKKITLINLFWRKGGVFFHDLARLMPDYEFLGVEGGYGKQEKGDLPNMDYMDNTPDARKIYSRTRILLMPSMYESYGRTAVEAMASGIPVIAAPTAGLMESIGNGGLFCSTDSTLKWVDQIKALDDETEYKKASEYSLKRFKEIEKKTEEELDQMERFLMDVVYKRV